MGLRPTAAPQTQEQGVQKKAALETKKAPKEENEAREIRKSRKQLEKEKLVRQGWSCPCIINVYFGGIDATYAAIWCLLYGNELQRQQAEARKLEEERISAEGQNEWADFLKRGALRTKDEPIVVLTTMGTFNYDYLLHKAAAEGEIGKVRDHFLLDGSESGRMALWLALWLGPDFYICALYVGTRVMCREGHQQTQSRRGEARGPEA